MLTAAQTRAHDFLAERNGLRCGWTACLEERAWASGRTSSRSSGWSAQKSTNAPLGATMEDSYLDVISEIVPGFLYIGGGNCPTNSAFFMERPACYVLNCSGESCASHVAECVGDLVEVVLVRFYKQQQCCGLLCPICGSCVAIIVCGCLRMTFLCTHSQTTTPEDVPKPSCAVTKYLQIKVIGITPIPIVIVCASHPSMQPSMRLPDFVVDAIPIVQRSAVCWMQSTTLLIATPLHISCPA
jgi:hypothetical protein